MSEKITSQQQYEHKTRPRWFLMEGTQDQHEYTDQAYQEPLSQPANGNKDDRAGSHTASWLMGGREVGKKQKSVLTCSHWVRYCHSDKSHYGSPFLLTCGGGRNRAVSPKNQRLQQVAVYRSDTDGTLFKQTFWGGENEGNLVFSHRHRRSFCGRCAVIWLWADEMFNTHALLDPL